MQGMLYVLNLLYFEGCVTMVHEPTQIPAPPLPPSPTAAGDVGG